jgi:hypothetical protein
MYCPECGNDAGEAKFCPECGADLAGLKNAMKGKTTSQAARGKGGGGQRPPKEPAAAAAPAQQGGRGLSPAMIWVGFGVLAVIVIIVVVVASGGFGGKNPPSTASTASATPVMGVVSGDYATLVQKANGFYDQGQKQFQSNNMNQAVAYFQAAAMTYAAAWRKQSTDPNVGTDYATALFYSQRIPDAIKQAQAVLKTNPDFQQAWFNLGLFYTHQQALAKQSNQPLAAKKARALAVAAYTKAIAINPTSQVGKSADQSLQQLPK